jgi:hypothetical protein
MQTVFIHAALMAVALIALAAAAFIAITQRKKKWWLKAHRPLGITSALLMLAGFIAVAMLPEGGGSSLITEIHGIIGGSAIALICAAPILGLLMFRLKKKWMRPAHRWAGRFAVLFAIINLTLGLLMTGLI